MRKLSLCALNAVANYKKSLEKWELALRVLVFTELITTRSRQSLKRTSPSVEVCLL